MTTETLVTGGALVSAAPAAPVAAAPVAAAPTEPVAAAPTEPVAAAPVVHDYSALKLEKDAAQNPDMLARVTAYAKDNSLSPEQAQKLLDSTSQEVKTYTDARNAEWQTMTQQWAADVRADNELGGAQFEQAMGVAKKVIHKFATPELIAQLDETGFGNHPELVRLLFRIGSTMKEDTLVLPSAVSQGAKRDTATTLYDHPTSN